MTRCQHDPRQYLGMPIGQYHCPDCLCMQVAGFEHGACEDGCEMQDDADRAAWTMANASLDPPAPPADGRPE